MRCERAAWVAGGLAALALVVSGCTGTEPEAETGDPSPAAQPATPTVAVPPPPRDITIDGVDPCLLLTKEQLDELKVTRQPRMSMSENLAPELKGAECVFGVQDRDVHYDYGVQPLATEGIEPWLTGKRLIDAKLVSVGGFPAVSFYHKGGGQGPGFSCYTSVGVAKGQQLLVTTQPIRRGFSQEQLCAMSERAAGLALQTLQTMK